MQHHLEMPRAPKKSELVILKNIDALVGESGQSLHNVEIGIDKGIIQWIHPTTHHHQAPSSQNIRHHRSGGVAMDASGFIAIPGLTNAHTHAPLAFFRDLSHTSLDLRSDEKNSMIERYLFPAEKNLDEELVYHLSFSYLIEALKAGCTQVVDHYYFAKGVGLASQEIGMRAYIGETIADLGGAQPGDDSFKRAEKLLEKNELNKNLIQIFIAPHAADTVSPKLLQKCSDLAKHHGLILHMHLAQSRGEHARVFSQHGISPVAYAHRYGALTKSSIVAHVLECSDDDLKCIKASGATIAFCPSSQIIYQNLAPIERFLKYEIPIVLGTDCAASSDHASLLDEMRTAYLLTKDRMREGAPSIRHIWEWADLNFQRIIDSTSDAKRKGIGLEVGAKADLVFLRKNITNEPVYDIAVNSVMSMGSNRVEHVMIDGQWVLWKKNCVKVKEEDLLKNYQKALLKTMKKH